MSARWWRFFEWLDNLIYRAIYHEEHRLNKAWEALDE